MIESMFVSKLSPGDVIGLETLLGTQQLNTIRLLPADGDGSSDGSDMNLPAEMNSYLNDINLFFIHYVFFFFANVNLFLFFHNNKMYSSLVV